MVQMAPSRRRQQWAVIVLGALSLAMWWIVTAPLHPNPARVPVWLWGPIVWSWPMLALGMASGRINRWLEAALVLVIVPLTVFMMGIAFDTGSGRGLRSLAPMHFAGRPIQLGTEHWEEWWNSCQETSVLVAGGWLVQRIGLMGCSRGPSLFLDSDGWQVHPGPLTDTFVLSTIAFSENSRPTRVSYGPYRLGLGGRLVRAGNAKELP